MKQNVLKRLGQLEVWHAAALRQEQAQYDSEGAREWFSAVLHAFNTERGPDESDFGALARCLGLRGPELGQLLRTPDEFNRVLDAALARVPQPEVAA